MILPFPSKQRVLNSPYYLTAYAGNQVVSINEWNNKLNLGMQRLEYWEI